jgi:hypothetical protein
MPFQPGQSGNPTGGRKSRIWRNAIERALTRRSKEGSLAEIDRLADALIDAALGMDVPALREFGDRVDGKVPQGIVGDDDESPIRVVGKIVREIVHKGDK